MFRSLCISISAFAVMASASIARADTKDDVAAAAKKLNDTNYSWKASTEGQFSSTQEGKTQKDGLTWVSMSIRDNTVEVIKQGDKGAIKTQDGWQSISEAAEGDGPGRFIAIMAQNLKTPSVQAQEIAEKAKEFKKSEDAFEATLSEEQVKALATFRRGGGDQGPQISNAKGSAKFWVKEGALSKMQYTVSGTRTRNNEDQEFTRTTTVEFKDVGTTKIDVPAEAKEKAKL